MSNKKLIEFHILQNHAASNLNRDDTGSVKDVIFGGVPRARISSQCLKRSIRKSDVFYDYCEEKELGIRSKYLPELIREKLLEKKYPQKEIDEFVDCITEVGGGKGKEKEEHSLTSQLIFFSYKDVKVIIEHFKEIKEIFEKTKNDKDVKKRNKARSTTIRDFIEKESSIPVDVALFGRMTTNQPIRDINASCQVAHAFSVNKQSKEFDYFTAVNELAENYTDDPGAAHLDETEFTSACFYKYISVDFDSLVKTLKDDKNLALNAVCGLLKSSVFSNPTGKQNSFASHTLPHFIGIEIKDKKIPVNYCNAFVEPVAEGNWLEKSVEKLTTFAVNSRMSYSLPVKEKAVFDTTGKGNDFGEKKNTLDDLESWLKEKL